MSTGYPQAPPVYDSERPPKAQQPLLGNEGPSNSWAESPDDGDIDDFKYGSTVASSAIEVRQAFVRRVYGVLFCQLLGTTVVGASLRYADAQIYIAQHSWLVWLPLIGSLVSMVALFFKRQSYPANVALLGTFTLFESLAIGSIVTFYDQVIVLQALVITLFVFAGLTLFAMQTKYDLSSMGGILYSILLVFFFTGVIGIFFPFSGWVEVFYSFVGVLLFSAYILYDTWLIQNRLSPDEWVLACVTLYLDVVNLFINLLRLLNSTQDN